MLALHFKRNDLLVLNIYLRVELITLKKIQFQLGKAAAKMSASQDGELKFNKCEEVGKVIDSLKTLKKDIEKTLKSPENGFNHEKFKKDYDNFKYVTKNAIDQASIHSNTLFFNLSDLFNRINTKIKSFFTKTVNKEPLSNESFSCSFLFKPKTAQALQQTENQIDKFIHRVLD